MNTYESSAKKIANIFSDARYTKSDLEKVAIATVMETREPIIMDRIEFFLEQFIKHRNSIEFGRDMDESFVVKDLFSSTFPDKMGSYEESSREDN